jgi:hypothetical protein
MSTVRKYVYLVIFLVGLDCCLFITFIETQAANVSSADDVAIALSQLENRFFEHQYDSDPDSDRITRLEEFVFGRQQAGSANQRIKHLLSTIPKEEESNQSTSIPPPTTRSNPVVPTKQISTQPLSSVRQNPAFDYGSYPRVTNLEQELLGHTYTNDSLPDRLKRLETKAYGAPSGSSDLCQRVDLLDDYAQRHDLYGEHKSVATPPAAAMTFNPTVPINNNYARHQLPESNDPSYPWRASAQPQTTYSSSGTFVGSAEERVSMMEAQVFNHTYPDKPLDQRLKKLTRKILPNQDITNLPPAAQTVKLWDTLHPNEKDQVASLVADVNEAYNTNDNSPNSKPSKHGSWLHRLANAGGSLAGTTMGPNSSMPSTYGTNAGYIPGMFPSNSHFIGATVGPGAGPAGLPVGFW